MNDVAWAGPEGAPKTWWGSQETAEPIVMGSVGGGLRSAMEIGWNNNGDDSEKMWSLIFCSTYIIRYICANILKKILSIYENLFLCFILAWCMYWVYIGRKNYKNNFVWLIILIIIILDEKRAQLDTSFATGLCTTTTFFVLSCPYHTHSQ